MDITSNEAARRLGIAGGALRQIETGVHPASLQLVYRAARLFRGDDEQVREVAAELLAAGNEGVPDKPPDQPTQPIGPNPRKDRETRKTGPKRARSAA
jgi:DNA-binding XRE family transcriptional regulator